MILITSEAVVADVEMERNRLSRWRPLKSVAVVSFRNTTRAYEPEMILLYKNVCVCIY